MAGHHDDPNARSHSGEKKQAFGFVRRFSASFWLAFMFWWTEHYPPFVLRTRRFFLWFAWRYSTVMRTGTLANARRILGSGASNEDCEDLAKSVIRNFYLAIYELGQCARLNQQQLADRIDGVDGREHYYAGRSQAKGAILVTAHIGSFELGAAALIGKNEILHVVFQRDVHPRFDRLRSRLRQQLGVREASIDVGWQLWPRLRDAIEADETVVIQGDRVMPGQQGVRVPFFDGHLSVPLGPFKLAQITGAPIFPVFSIRTTIGRVRLIIEEPLTITRDEGRIDGNHPAPKKFAALLEERVRANPEQWVMVYPAWDEDQHGKDSTG